MTGNGTSRHVRYALGYIALGLLNEASEELEKIASEDRCADEVLAVRLELHMECKHWDEVIKVGRDVTKRDPSNERGWISLAYALRELQRVEEAREVLLEAEPLHGAQSATLHYNLACYYCLLGHLSTARECLARACKMNPECKKDALDDPDLSALWCN